MLWPVVASAACCAFSPEMPMLISELAMRALYYSEYSANLAIAAWIGPLVSTRRIFAA